MCICSLLVDITPFDPVSFHPTDLASNALGASPLLLRVLVEEGMDVNLTLPGPGRLTLLHSMLVAVPVAVTGSQAWLEGMQLPLNQSKHQVQKAAWLKSV